ncbi:MAG TPA: DJ-1/PfpI family protein [Solirubrobacteraceae bacterium]|jgi:putative intracellular protease/amidase|nr:DJ-1/PfpI family protein [Solirubrobacteraceae bacterium]
MKIAIPIFDGFTALDAVGPYEVLSRLPGAQVSFIAEQAGAKIADTGMLSLLATSTLHELPHPDVLVVPGGPGVRDLLDHRPLLDWLAAADEHSSWTASVCTGSLLLAAAGLLDGRRATGHWLEMDALHKLGAQPVSERVVAEGKLLTSAGVSAGIDMGLALAAQIAGEQVAMAIQLAIEYDPQPPFDSGSPARAPEEVVQAVREAATRRQLRRSQQPVS